MLSLIRQFEFESSEPKKLYQLFKQTGCTYGETLR